MAHIKDTASVITDVPKIMGSIPDVGDENIDTTARFVWAAIISRVHMATARRQTRDGRPGIQWSGSVNKVIESLWPEMSGGYTLDKNEIKTINVALNRYHRESGNLICIRRGSREIASVWWVAEHWSTLTVTKTADKIEEIQEEEVMPNTTEQVTMYSCRDKNCDYTTEHAQLRAVHERDKHGFAYRNGERVDIPSGKLTDNETCVLILRVADKIESPMSKYGFLRKAQELDPRATGPQVHRLLREMAQDESCDLIQHGSSEYYTLYFLRSRVETEQAKLVEKLRTQQTAPIEGVQKGEPAAVLPAGLILPEDPHTIGWHISNLEYLIADLKTMDGVEVELLRAQLSAKDEEMTALKDELAQVTQERDQLQQTLDVIRKQIMGKGI